MAETVALPVIDQRAAFKHSFYWYTIPDPINNPDVKVPLPLEGYAAKMQLRSEQGATGTTTLLAEWSTLNGKLVLTGNEIRIFVPRSETSAYTFDEGFYDVLVWPTADPEDVTRMTQGTVKLSKGTTEL